MAILKRIVELPESVQAVLDQSVSASSYSRRDFLRYDQSDVPHVSCSILTEASLKPESELYTQDDFNATGDQMKFKQDLIQRIDLWVNPNNTQWSVPLREASQKTKGGSIRFSWPRTGKYKSHRYFDIFNVSFTFQTGSIYTDRLGENEGKTPPGLFDFYSFLQLLNAPRKLPDGGANWHVVKYTSRVFPEITLRGWFLPEGTSFPDSPDSGFALQWTAAMEVHSTTPPLWNAAELASVFGTRM